MVALFLPELFLHWKRLVFWSVSSAAAAVVGNDVVGLFLLFPFVLFELFELKVLLVAHDLLSS